MQDKVRVLKIVFGQEISQEEIPLFRGAVINSLESNDVLFHNHDGDGLRYSYPLIQYKRIGGKAAIVCAGDGTESIGEFFKCWNFDVSIGGRNVSLKVDSVDARQVLVQVWDDLFVYRIRKWLPLNKENYERFVLMDGLAEKYVFMEQLLTGNILSFAKGVGIHFENQVKCKITEVSEPVSIFYKGVKFMGFDAMFKTNVSLPDYVGLGKGVSLGMGMLKRFNNEN
ncbi:MAG: hypothetical protein MJZ78_06830 [Bacteroidales bacterium]|nr:hypothetical protein [Bacteroidales bacterium]